MHLVYQEKSFEATYLIIDAVNQDGIIKGCLGKAGANFRLYLPEKTIKIEDIYDIHSKFYDTYSNPEDLLCLETPEDLWRK